MRSSFVILITEHSDNSHCEVCYQGARIALRLTLSYMERIMLRANSVSSIFRATSHLLAFLWLIVFSVSVAYAVPSYSRQTGMPCATCHYTPPELTPFGRTFKLEGYTFVTKAQITDDKKDHNAALQLLEIFPLSAIIDISLTSLKTPQPGTQNGNLQFPQAASLFLAGAWTSHVGSFVQVTYDSQGDHFSCDNTDIRYANHTTLRSKDFLYGLTLNNSPTVEDVWNSTPSWGYPWLSPSSVPSPSIKPLIVGALAQDVAGLGAYTMWNEHLYADFTLYRSEHAGGPQPLTGTNFAINIHRVAPYWRLAWQQSWGLNYLEVGTYGIFVNSFPGGLILPTDTYLDAAVDLQYERPFGVNLLTCHTTYIRERSNLNGTFAAGGAAEPSHHLDAFRADATYHLRSRYTFTLAGFSTTGNADPILFAPAPVTGSLLGSPNSGGFIGQAGFWPVQNVEVSAAYTAYTKFNGASQNYDGSGRSASSNNSIYIALWLNY